MSKLFYDISSFLRELTACRLEDITLETYLRKIYMYSSQKNLIFILYTKLEVNPIQWDGIHALVENYWHFGAIRASSHPK